MQRPRSPGAAANYRKGLGTWRRRRGRACGLRSAGWRRRQAAAAARERAAALLQRLLAGLAGRLGRRVDALLLSLRLLLGLVELLLDVGALCRGRLGDRLLRGRVGGGVVEGQVLGLGEQEEVV